MITFLICILLLILGYAAYGRVVEKIAAPDSEQQTPCYAKQDGVDFVPMPAWKVFIIQFLNIAGTGPIFGTIQGILFGPAAYLWIVLGCIFGGAVHDYFAGMISIKRGGASLPEIIGDELGATARASQRFLAIFLMILVVAVFVKTPAGLLSSMTGSIGSLDGYWFWVVVIYAYYLIAAILPIGKIIGKVYPFFGIMLILMAICIGASIFTHDVSLLPEITDAFENHYPGGALPIFPGLCITIACGAVSGFHATQSPMMARCMKNERLGRPIFYGSMITEGVMAMIWATAAIQFASGLDVAGNTPYEKLLNAMQVVNADGTTSMNPAILVNGICNDWLGASGAVLAILGVVFAPITTGDTALRSARLIIADILHIPQDSILRRVSLCLPIFAVSVVLLFVQFGVLWRYFAWFNQTFSIFTFFAITVYLAKQRKPYLITLLPGLFMMFVCVSYICIDSNSLNLGESISYGVGFTSSVLALMWFLAWKRNNIPFPQHKEEEVSLWRNLIAVSAAICVGPIMRFFLPRDILLSISDGIFLPLYSYFLCAVKMLVVPLIFFSLAKSFASIRGVRSFGYTGSKVLLIAAITTVVSMLVALSGFEVVSFFGFKQGAVATFSISDETFMGGVSTIEKLFSIAPRRFLNTMEIADVVQTIFFAILMGSASGSAGKYSDRIVDFIEAANTLVTSMTGLVMKLLPIAVFGAMVNIIIFSTADHIMSILSWIVVCLGCAVIMIFIYLLALPLFAGINPIRFVREFLPALRVAITTASSYAAQPVTMESCKRLGLNERIFGFSIPLGTSINMSGTSIFYVSVVLFLAAVCGVHIDEATKLAVLFCAAILSMSTPAVTGGAFACITMLLALSGVPVESVVLVLCIMPLIDPVLTLLNVLGNGVLTCIVGREEKS